MKYEQFYQVWGVCDRSAWELSHELYRLGVSHSIRIGSGIRWVDLRKDQPSKVHITTSVNKLKTSAINFVVASYAEVALTNYPLMKGSLSDALVSPSRIKPAIKSMSVMDYVEQIAKPSHLNSIQTLIYKIQPYSLRKSTQKLVLDFFRGSVPKRTVLQELSRSYKTARIVPHIKDSSVLKNAMEQLRTKTPEQIELETGVPAFELRYISKERP